jgi:predicted transcriptional regulator
MEVHFTPEQEERLTQIANRTGKAAEEVVREHVVRMLEEEERFLKAVRKGFASLDRGEYLTHAEVGRRLKKLLKSR